MNYRDLIVKLLKTRGSMNVIDSALMADFANLPDPDAGFVKWCKLHHIKVEKNSDENSITLTLDPPLH